jgi:cell fate regulator YaaT (PSP1 superfamily)
MRQIGARDEARVLGGISSCGRMLCCSTFLGSFTAVSIKMAKEQDLSLNPVQISGLCERLMCCLKYENETYKEARKEIPDWGTSVSTTDGEGIVKGVNYLTRTLRIQLQGKEHLEEYNVNDVQVLKQGKHS